MEKRNIKAYSLIIFFFFLGLGNPGLGWLGRSNSFLPSGKPAQFFKGPLWEAPRHIKTGNEQKQLFPEKEIPRYLQRTFKNSV